MRELLTIALMIAATALLIKWGAWLLSNIDEALERPPSGPGCHPFWAEPVVSGKAGIPDATKPAANEIGEGGMSPSGATGFATHQPEEPSNKPLDGGF